MAQVAITVNGRTYRLECDDGEEQHLLGLSELMGQQIESLKGRFGQVGDDRLMLMAGLMIADELTEAKRKLAEANARLEEIDRRQASAEELVEARQKEMAGRIGAAAERIEALNAVLATQPEQRE